MQVVRTTHWLRADYVTWIRSAATLAASWTTAMPYSQRTPRLWRSQVDAEYDLAQIYLQQP